MILTVTLNPSVDIGYQLNTFELDGVNRVETVSKTAGGKGLNVTRVLRLLNEDTGAAGFLGGSLGNFIHAQLQELGVKDFFIEIDGETRNCIAVLHEGKQTEILESGPEIAEADAERFMKGYRDWLEAMDVITLSGSLPKGMPDDYYARLIAIAAEADVPVLLDTKGELLNQALRTDKKPFLIKPNEDELADLLGEKPENLIAALHAPIFAGIEWIVVTLGARGALVKHLDTIYKVSPPQVNAVNPVGSGDSVIAGFASGLVRKLPEIELMKYALSMGVLNALEEKTGHINPDRVEWCMKQMKVEKVC